MTTPSAPPEFPFASVLEVARDRAGKLEATPLEMLALMQIELLSQLLAVAIEHYALDKRELDRLDPRSRLWKPGGPQ